jgi:hypothetical protein
MRIFMIIAFVGALVLGAWANNSTDAAAGKGGTASTATPALMMPPSERGILLNLDF